MKRTQQKHALEFDATGLYSANTVLGMELDVLPAHVDAARCFGNGYEALGVCMLCGATINHGFDSKPQFFDVEKPFKTNVKPIIHQKRKLRNIGFVWF
jgi:hypothetical protein